MLFKLLFCLGFAASAWAEENNLKDKLRFLKELKKIFLLNKTRLSKQEKNLKFVLLPNPKVITIKQKKYRF